MIKKIHLFCFILSFAFRVSSGADVNQTTLEQLFRAHCRSLQHTEVKNPPFVICFSATPGMGKTYVANLLEEKYQAVRISSDDIRRLVRQLDASLPTESALEAYWSYFMNHYKEPNQFLILDASIDRRYKLIFSYVEEKKIPYVVIRLQVPHEDVLDRLSMREGENKEKYVKHLDAWKADYEAFQEAYPNSFVLKNGKADQLDLDALYSHISEQCDAVLST